jgi:transcriptional regulator with XRE-family HTH domain
MNNIKEYSTIFATKLNFALDLINIAPIQYGRTKAIEKIINEKATTVNNFLFAGRMPKENKRLAIADAIGVSYDYLYNDEISVQSISKPTIHKENNCYLVPFINENEIFTIKDIQVYPIKNRLPLMFPNFDNLIEKYGKSIYVTNLNNAIVKPYIDFGSDIIYSEQVNFENFQLVISYDNKQNKVIIKRIIEENGSLYIEHLNENLRLTRTSLNQQDCFLSVVLAYSTTFSPQENIQINDF